MANQYVNKVVYNDAVLIDITDSNALAGGVMSGKTIYLPSGAKDVGTNPGNQIEITVSKAWTYKCSWTGLRNTTSGTSGSRFYRNGTDEQ